MPNDIRITRSPQSGKRALPTRPGTESRQLGSREDGAAVETMASSKWRADNDSSFTKNATNDTSPRESHWNIVRRKVIEDSRPRSPRVNKWSFLQKTKSSRNLLNSSSTTSEKPKGRFTPPLKRASSEENFSNKPMPQENVASPRLQRERNDRQLLKQRSMEFIDVFKKFEGGNDRDFEMNSKEREKARQARLAKKKEEEAIGEFFRGLDEVRLFLKQTEIDFKQIRVKCTILKHDLSELHDMISSSP